MRKLHALATAAVAVAVAFFVLGADGAIGVEITRVQQRFPWNGYVDIDYTVTLGENDAIDPAVDRLEFSAVNRAVEPAVTNRILTILTGTPELTAGSHRLTWYALGDGVSYNSANVDILAVGKRYSTQYMVVDISGGTSADVWPVTFLDGEPQGGFCTDEYRTSKLVLRLVPPGTYMAGSPTDEPGRAADREAQHPVTISKPFWIGIFILTEYQYALMKTGDATGKSTVPQYNGWESNAMLMPTALNNLNAKSRAKDGDGGWTASVGTFALPTEFQWEYACRAGTTGPLATNEVATTTSKLTAQFGQMGSLSRTTVGTLQPNPLGLYDVHGNVSEYCSDFATFDVLKLKQYVDPVGPAKSDIQWANKYSHVFRGGDPVNGMTVGRCRSAFRFCSWTRGDAVPYPVGCRLSCTVAE